MDPKEITKLALSLREYGDKVLAGDFKLSLSGPILRALNDSFTLIAESADLTSPQSFQVVKPNNSKSEVFRDLQLIHDFVQKTVLLCISQFLGDEDFEGNIDISKFRSLRRLEIHKVNIKQIVGIQPLRAQLQHLICNRCLNSVADIITYCGGDDSNGFVWNELKTANFSYNGLKSVDSSLEFTQWLQHLTLSYNQLTSVAAIKWLPQLKVLDLRYNRLTTIPSFHTEASRRLQVLIISNNFVEDLMGISRLEALAELDLSNNCLLDHISLLPLSTLISLRYLNLQGNPLACHPQHRKAATAYLHKNTASVKFILDTEPLSKTEKTYVGRYPNFQSVLTMRLTAETRSSGQSTPTRKSQGVTPSSSVGSIKSIKLNETEASAMTTSMSEKQKKIKVRSVQIEENKTEQDECNKTPHGLDPESSMHMEASTDHLETKKQLEDLREKYGAGWLNSHNASVVQSVLGLDTLGSSEECLSQKTLINDYLNDIEIPQIDTTENSTYTEATMLTSTPINTKDNEAFNFSSDTIVLENKQEENSEPSIYKTATSHIDEIYSSDVQQSEIDSVSDPEDNEITYIVTGKGSTDQHFLAISDTYIKEKDILTRRTKTKWSLKILESCERIKSNTLRINFDTIKKDKKERIYEVEEGLCQDMENLLRAVLSKRQLSEMNQILYRCINCSCQFSRERIFQRRNPVIFCPECKKSFVVEVSESPKTSVSPPKVPASSNSQNISIGNQEPAVGQTENQSSNRQEPEKSASHSSIANDKGTWRLSAHKNISSAGSLNESSSCSKISNSESSFDSNQSIAGSSTNDRDQDFNFSKNCESDVEVLSNPSQSSIEVLDHGHPSRKTSEERKISRIPSLETIQDQSVQNTPGTLITKETSTETSHNDLPIKDTMVEGINKKVSLGPINLTESSSSGSVTDSICTAYEQGDKDTSLTLDAHRKILQPAKENKKEESIISSMFGGLFQSTNLLMSRSQKPPGLESPACDQFKFNYKDFSDVDHRLKLFFYQTKFEDDSEHFKWIVKGKIYNENNNQLCEGILVVSTAKFYVMEIFGAENDDIQKWLKQMLSGTVDRIEGVQLLPWKIGMSFKIKGWGQFSLILQDISRTDSLLLFFANNPLPDECTIDYQPAEKVRTKLTSFVKEGQLKMFSILNKCEISSENTEQVFSPTAFFTTDTHLYLTSTNLSWLSDNSNADVEPGLMQLMSNIVEVVTPAKNVFTINFLDEIQNKYELWTCTFETVENAESCLNAIGQSWEKLFGVPFFVSN